MDEKRLRYFLAVVEDGSVTRAATRLHVAQPSLSQTLRALEGELGVELFHRVGRGFGCRRPATRWSARRARC